MWSKIGVVIYSWGGLELPFCREIHWLFIPGVAWNCHFVVNLRGNLQLGWLGVAILWQIYLVIYGWGGLELQFGCKFTWCLWVWYFGVPTLSSIYMVIHSQGALKLQFSCCFA